MHGQKNIKYDLVLPFTTYSTLRFPQGAYTHIFVTHQTLLVILKTTLEKSYISHGR